MSEIMSEKNKQYLEYIGLIFFTQMSISFHMNQS